MRDWLGRQLMRMSGASRLQPPLRDLIDRVGRLVDRDLVALRQHQRYAALALLRERYPDTFDLAGYELSVFSQNGEDGVLAEILHRIGVQNRTFVEFGAGDGTENCCSLLADVLGWSGVFAEVDATLFGQLHAKYRNNSSITTLDAAITADNIEATFAAAGVPEDFDVLSIDVDGADYWIWRALERWHPRVVIIEHNASLDASVPKVQSPDAPPWDDTSYFGASVAALTALGETKGHTLVHIELSGANAFFVRSDLLWPDVRPVVLRGPSYGLAGHRHAPDPMQRTYVDPEP